MKHMSCICASLSSKDIRGLNNGVKYFLKEYFYFNVILFSSFVILAHYKVYIFHERITENRFGIKIRMLVQNCVSTHLESPRGLTIATEGSRDPFLIIPGSFDNPQRPSLLMS